jgi:hypothetical protein
MDDESPESPQMTVNDDGTITWSGVVLSAQDDPYLCQTPALLQGPPGPMPDLSDLPIPGTMQEAAIRFVVDGWEYRFRSIDHARNVREKLMNMTLEGEL